ncbi:hypothetical protein K438DRAFT_1615949 [Mycena galopus ATCC 62051]|nr:hypothetical protein K438DRAFT_1615949 [Mycena galopus ATCC 62051]
MESAEVLFKEAGFVTESRAKGRKYTLTERRRISEQVLRQYCAAANGNRKGNTDRTEYVWLDEFCLSQEGAQDEDTIEQQRSVELGRLADIFGKASYVGVFCHELDCDHTGLSCIWGTRLFTLPEILHAQAVLRMTRKRVGEDIVTHIFPTPAPAFRSAMQTQAAHGDRWHLYAIFQHTVNAGAVPWQSAIHALIVEAIRRDEAGGFRDHKFLGKALNGLLPRRARLQDLGSSGWNDLAWLLELNQGFYNAASLAALCSIADDESVSWLGKPIHPVAGNERLEPIVTAFPVSLSRNDSETQEVFSESHPPLTIIGAETLGLRPTLKRDPYGLYNNEEMGALKRLAIWTSVILGAISMREVASGHLRGLLLYGLTAVLYSVIEMLVGTMYLERDGWIFLDDSKWGEKLGDTLGEQDNTLRNPVNWG